MKRKHMGVVILCTVLMLNIIFTQFMVHQYFYENYVKTILFGGFNIILLPLAIYVYQKTEKRDEHE